MRILDGFDAVFLGLGAQRARVVEVPGRELAGAETALGWLERVNAGGGEDLNGRQMLVLGGGDTAMDCARAARRLGARVTVAYRGPVTRLRALPKEVALAREEGVDFLFEHCPEAIQGAAKAQGVRFGNGETIAADRVVIAFGQQPAPPPWLAGLGVVLEADGRIRVDASGRTNHPRIYAGGDATHGPDLAVTAMAAGIRAAEGMLVAVGRRRKAA